jgi:hypothetical protein
VVAPEIDREGSGRAATLRSMASMNQAALRFFSKPIPVGNQETLPGPGARHILCLLCVNEKGKAAR